MTDNEIKAAICEHLGWTKHLVPSNDEMEDARLGRGAYEGVPGYPVGSGPLGGMQTTWWKDPNGKFATRPNYPNDLNAMAEAVKTLETGFDGSQADDYQQTLWSIVNPGVQWEPQSLYDVGYLQNMLEATARQRAEAFIKTVCPEKWKGNE